MMLSPQAVLGLEQLRWMAEFAFQERCCWGRWPSRSLTICWIFEQSLRDHP